ncbi:MULTISPECIES: hypothetical protein [unclassified Variovorax]|jgi:hypothetical protein|uniref:hypothetical protein n=1 Tax=unclassified Variovorax TaxID=663243 RepID=UPI003ED1537A
MFGGHVGRIAAGMANRDAAMQQRGVTRRRRPYGRQQREGAGMFKALVNRRDHHNIDVSGIVN